tara:strand:- start:3682 stop:3900 length:219 start_codon:yes stop_codon:yes gene_type:complete
MDALTRYNLIEAVVQHDDFHDNDEKLVQNILDVLKIGVDELCEDKRPTDIFGDAAVIKNLEDEGYECKLIGL